jgi:hypothetical protein
VGRYKNESIARARPSDEIVEIAGGVNDTDDFHTAIDDAIEDEISAKRKRAQIASKVWAGATYARVAR